jgi:hypothetical protein
MLRRLVLHVRQNTVAYVALFFALSGASAYAANTIGSADIVDNQVYSADVRDDTLTGGGLRSVDIATGAVTSLEVRDDTVSGGGLLAQDLAPNSVRSSEVLDSSLTGVDVQNGEFTGDDVAFCSLDGSDVLDNSLTGSDINESTLVGVKDGDSCGNSGAALFVNARLCAGSDGANRQLFAAHAFCASIGLRLPSWGEAVLLAVRHDVPGVDGADRFWTDEVSYATFYAQVGTDSAIHDVTAFVIDEDGNGYGTVSFNPHRTVCVTTPD